MQGDKMSTPPPERADSVVDLASLLTPRQNLTDSPFVVSPDDLRWVDDIEEETQIEPFHIPILRSPFFVQSEKSTITTAETVISAPPPPPPLMPFMQILDDDNDSPGGPSVEAVEVDWAVVDVHPEDRPVQVPLPRTRAKSSSFSIAFPKLPPPLPPTPPPPPLPPQVYSRNPSSGYGFSEGRRLSTAQIDPSADVFSPTVQYVSSPRRRSLLMQDTGGAIPFSKPRAKSVCVSDWNQLNSLEVRRLPPRAVSAVQSNQDFSPSQPTYRDDNV